MTKQRGDGDGCLVMLIVVMVVLLVFVCTKEKPQAEDPALLWHDEGENLKSRRVPGGTLYLETYRGSMVFVSDK